MLAKNPLTAQLCKLNQSRAHEFLQIVRTKIQEYQGVMPLQLGFAPVRYRSRHEGWEHDRALVAVWPPVRLSEKQVDSLERYASELVAPDTMEGRRDVFGTPVKIGNYLSSKAAAVLTIRGYLFSQSSHQNKGLFVGRKFSSVRQATTIPRREKGTWLYGGEGFVELRLDDAITNLTAAEYLVSVSRILAQQEQHNHREMVYDVYRALMSTQIDRKEQGELIGLDEALDFMRWTLFPASVIPPARAYGVKNRAVLVAGVYGVGKTSLAKVLSRENNGTLFIPVHANDILETLVKDEDDDDNLDLFAEARALQNRTGADITLFCDDIEFALLDPEKSERSAPAIARNATLLNKLQGVGTGKTLLSGSTNNPALIDPRFLQFGRIGYIFHIPLPDAEKRRKTFEFYMHGVRVTGVKYQHLADQTEGFTNRDIEEICSKAGRFALERAARAIQEGEATTYDAAKKLTLESTEGFPIIHEDVERAYTEVKKFVRVAELKKLDALIRTFCTNSRMPYHHQII